MSECLRKKIQSFSNTLVYGYSGSLGQILGTNICFSTLMLTLGKNSSLFILTCHIQTAPARQNFYTHTHTPGPLVICLVTCYDVNKSHNTSGQIISFAARQLHTDDIIINDSSPFFFQGISL